MKSNAFGAALLCGGLFLLAASPAYAMHGSAWIVADQPLDRVNVTLTKDGAPVGQMQTDAKGEIVLKALAPGDYFIVVDGLSLVNGMDKFAAPPPKKESHSSFSLGIGGFAGGGSSRSSSGHEGAAGQTGHENSSSHTSGGVGVGLSIPIGSSDGNPAPQGYPITAINITLPSNPDANTANWGTGTSLNLAFESPYCRDAAMQGLHIGFTIPPGKGGPVSIRIKAGNTGT